MILQVLNNSSDRNSFRWVTLHAIAVYFCIMRTYQRAALKNIHNDCVMSLKKVFYQDWSWVFYIHPQSHHSKLLMFCPQICFRVALILVRIWKTVFHRNFWNCLKSGLSLKEKVRSSDEYRLVISFTVFVR